MTIGPVKYPYPMFVNGFSCLNGAEEELARRHVDPVHPASGPFNRDAASDQSRHEGDRVKIAAKAETDPNGTGTGDRSAKPQPAPARAAPGEPGSLFSTRA